MRVCKKSLLALLISMFLLPVAGRASHIYGADLYYTWLGGNSYSITMAVYGDCSGSAFPNLQSGSPQISIYDDQTSTTSPYQTISLTLNAPAAGVEVTPVCAQQQNQTTCINPNNPIPGVKRFIYSATVTIPTASTGWRFRFTGNMGGNNQAGRSNSIGNIVFTGNPPSSLMNLEATLNNANGHNSSPQFTTIPTPFYCNNIAQQYNQGAVDPDNDSLGYTLAPALEPGGIVSYQPGYSATSPLSTSGPMVLNPVTGQISFTPNAVQRSVVVNKAFEYRNGVLVGTAMREMTFIILATCTGVPPIGPLDTAVVNISGGSLTSATEFVTCSGSVAPVHFNIKPVDPNGDTINVALNGLPAGATAAITGNNTTSPIISFNWNATGAAPGAYTFFATYKDFGCPLSNQQTIAYTVYVIRPNALSTLILAPTNCVHKARVQLNTLYGLTPRTITISQGGNVLHTISDNTGTNIDSLAAGTYNVSISSPHLDCVSQFTLTVVDSGIYPFKPLVTPAFYCLNDVPVPLTAIPATAATLHWYDGGGNPLPAAPTPSTATAGIFNYFVSQQYLVCESLKDTAKVYVTKRPVASIVAPATLCTHDTATISFNGAVGVGPIIAYNWGFDGADNVLGSGAGPYEVNWLTPGNRTITLQVFENQCPSFPDTVHTLVKPSPNSVFTAPNEACRLDTFSTQYNITGLPGEQYTWGFDGATVASGTGRGPYRITYADAGIKHLTLFIDLNGCTDTSSRDVLIHETPATQITNTPGTVCLADKIYLMATSNLPATYNWAPADRIFTDPDGAVFTRVMLPTTYTVYAHSTFGCSDSAKITYTKVEPCCTFSYPNAFSPNGDGRNDTYKVITYGNDQSYEFSIYDRWGHRVFYTFDSRLGWDGTYGGKPCSTGTYFYYLKARCYTGHDEMAKGDFELLR